MTKTMTGLMAVRLCAPLSVLLLPVAGVVAPLLELLLPVAGVPGVVGVAGVPGVVGVPGAAVVRMMIVQLSSEPMPIPEYRVSFK